MWIQRIVDGLNSRSSRVEPGREDYPSAAVALLIHADSLLFIRRSIHPKDPWSGHMAFPGGHVDDTDVDEVAAAIRETFEETGVDLRNADLLGRLNDCASPSVVPRLSIAAFVFVLKDEPTLTLNHEVADVRWFNIERLCSREGRGTLPWTWKGKKISMPAVRMDGVVVWGLTLRFVDEIVQRMEDA